MQPTDEIAVLSKEEIKDLVILRRSASPGPVYQRSNGECCGLDGLKVMPFCVDEVEYGCFTNEDADFIASMYGDNFERLVATIEALQAKCEELEKDAAKEPTRNDLVRMASQTCDSIEILQVEVDGLRVQIAALEKERDGLRLISSIATAALQVAPQPTPHDVHYDQELFMKIYREWWIRRLPDVSLRYQLDRAAGLQGDSR